MIYFPLPYSSTQVHVVYNDVALFSNNLLMQEFIYFKTDMHVLDLDFNIYFI